MVDSIVTFSYFLLAFESMLVIISELVCKHVAFEGRLKISIQGQKFRAKNQDIEIKPHQMKL